MEKLFEYIIEQTKGFFPEKKLELFFASVEKEAARLEFTNASSANFERIIKSFFDVRAFISDALKYPHYVEIIAAVAHHSNFLTDIIVRNPSVVYKILTPSFLLPSLNENDLEGEVVKNCGALKSFSSKVKFLRRFKNKHLLTVAVRDLLGFSDLLTTVSELSALARVILRKLFSLALNETLAQKQIPFTNIEYAIVSLGKLGGNELNYSSDADLIFFYDSNYKIDDRLDVFEIMSDAISLFASVSSELTADGFLYRIDFRLRPDGKYSPLVKSYKDYIRYYETRGENWERQMLLKLSYLGGSEKLYRKFSNYLTPFIFPSEIPKNHFESVRRMKKQIEKSAEGNYDIKKIKGGIRDIEFSVQVLQTLNGRKFPELREPNTMLAIERLAEKKLLNDNERKTLTENYIFYREIEHYLQLVNDTQTHTIPEKGETLLKLVKFLGFKNEKAFFSDLEKRRKKVSKIYAGIVKAENSIAQKEKLTFEDEKKARKNLRFILTGENLFEAKAFDKITLERAAELEKPLLSELSKLNYPDIALENFAKILSVTKTQSVFLGEMSNTDFLKLFLSFCENSEKFVNAILQNPSFVDDIISREVFPDVAAKTENLKKFMFRLTVNALAGILTPPEIAKFISQRVNEKISALAKKHFGERVFVASLGSLALESMNFGSDIDLLIIARNSSDTFELQSKAEKFLAALNKTSEPFRADLRLRPEGDGAQLIWDIASVQKYFEKRITAWELTAFSKIKFVTGNKALFEEFVNIYVDKLKFLDKNKFLSELRSVYGKLITTKTRFTNSFDIKFSHGGITTLDFAIIPQTLFSQNTESLKTIILDSGQSPYGEEFFAVRQKLISLIIALQLVFDTNKHTLPASTESLKRFENLLKHLNMLTDFRKLDELKKRIVKAFNETYG